MLLFEHVAFGILQSHGLRRFRNAGAVSVGVVAAVVGDLPVLFTGGPGTIDYLAHRVAANSIVLAPLWSLVPVAAVWCALRGRLRNSLGQLYLLSLFAYCGHIFLDWVTPYGTQLFYPFGGRVYSGDFFNSFDPFLTTVSIAIIVVFIKGAIRRTGRKLLSTRALLIFAGLYVLYAGATGIHRHVASRAYRDHVTGRYPAARYVTTVPRSFWRWKGVGETDRHYIVTVRSSGKIVDRQYLRTLEVPQQVSTDAYYVKFLDYARFPVAVLGEREVSVMNLIYAPGSYRLILKLDDKGNVRLREVTGFDPFDRGL